MAKLFLYHQLCEDYAETIQRPISSNLDARAIQELGKHFLVYILKYVLMHVDVGRTKTGSSSKSSTITASCSEVDQESSTVLRS